MIESPIVALANALDAFTDAAKAAGEAADWQFLPHGPAAQDWSDSELAGEGLLMTPLEDSYRSGSLLHEAVNDLARGLAILLRSGGLAFSSNVVARGLAESASRGWYLLEQGVAPEERVRRMMNDRLHAMKAQRSYWANLPYTSGENAIASRDAIHEYAQTRGWVVTPEDGYWASHVGGRRPKNSALLEACISAGQPKSVPSQALARMFYSSTSATAHGALHGVTANTSVVVGDDGVLRMRSRPLTAEAAARVMAVPIIAYGNFFDALAAQAGWNTDPSVQSRERLGHVVHATMLTDVE